ncbi:mannosyl-oligosaccharide alpha-1,2-mannosidase IA isoform X2 [Stomoxys calcitrans]|uniref:mannosyl-oligosaccharide alpha-1,2-mannosidase IA isoform X2 n=1 Tax=Stomoxys calcitrans TaxID=35570 RepID=UPI0027E37933|nr:mannosyl-oligosaccharide alpha-1,2-mannosidase IA isoform X2 [Stomoxys calcitrans]
MYRIGPIGRKSNFHNREKCLIGLVLATLCFLCFGGIFLLPDNFGGDKVLRVYKQFQKAGPEIFIPAPPLAGHAAKDQDPHFMNDKQKLQAKIKEELGEILDKPQLQQDTVDSEDVADVGGDNGSPQQFDDTAAGGEQGAAPPVNAKQNHHHYNDNVNNNNNHKNNVNGSPDDVAALDTNNLPLGNVHLQMPLGGHADGDASVEDKRLKVKEVS